MGWQEDFSARLARQDLSGMVFYVRTVHINGWGNEWTACSHLGFGAPAIIDPSSVSVGASRVQAQSWGSSLGGWSFSVTDATSMLEALTRGVVLELRVGFPGYAVSDMETVAMGKLRRLQWTNGRWRVDMGDAIGLMETRLDAQSTQQSWCHTTTELDLMSGNYSGGATLNIYIGDTANYEKATGEPGMLMIYSSTYTGSGANPVYVQYTTTPSSTSFGGCTVDVGGTDFSGTYNDGAVVAEVANLVGHPCDLLERLLVSTGGGTNGDNDIFPASWGMGLDSSYVAQDELTAWKSVVTASSGDYEWNVLVEASMETVDGGSHLTRAAPVDNMLATFLQYGRPAGIWPVFSQGAFALRAVQRTTNARTADIYHTEFEVTDADIVRVERYEAWDPEGAAEYEKLTLVGGDAIEPWTPEGWYLSNGQLLPNYLLPWIPPQVTHAATEDSSTALTPESLPAANEARVHVPGAVENAAAMLSDDNDRLFQWFARVPEHWTITLGGLRAAILVPGDVITLSTDVIPGRPVGRSLSVSRRDVMVTAVNANWAGASVTIDCKSLPSQYLVAS